MMEVLRFFFDDGWHFAGLVVVLAICSQFFPLFVGTTVRSND